VIAEAVDTATAIGWAIVAWIVAAAAVFTVCLFTGVLVGAWGWKTLRKRCAPARRPESPSRGSRDAGTPPSPARARSAPSWVRDDHDRQEAA
jgi:hypothetical protein